MPGCGLRRSRATERPCGLAIIRLLRWWGSEGPADVEPGDSRLLADGRGEVGVVPVAGPGSRRSASRS